MTRRRVRVLAALGLGAIVALGAWAAGLLWFTGLIPNEPLDDPRVTDAVVVLTGGSGRLEAGLDQLGQNRAKKLFVSGVYRGVEVAKLLDLSTQAPERVECCIVLGYSADNTTGNARETAEWMSREGYRSLRLVTAAYHMPRSLLEFRRAMPTVEIIAGQPVPSPAKKTRAKKDAKPKRVSALDAAAEVLRKASNPMHAQEMIAAMAEQGLWSSPNGKTPHATLYAAILREIRAKGEAARFRKAERGQFEFHAA